MKTLQLLTITALVTTLGMSNLNAQESSHEKHDRVDNKRVTVGENKHREIKKESKHEIKHRDKRVQVRSHPPKIEKPPHTAKHIKMLKRGDRGPAVRALQRALKREGFYRGHVDGIFGKGVKHAVKRFQREHRLYADGIAGAETLRRLHVK